MSLPKQVQAQAEEAERLEQALAAATAPAPTPITETPPEAAEPEGASPEAEPVVETEVPTPEAPKPDEEAWQQRYKVLKGKYDAEIPRMQSEVAELRSQLNAALASIDTLKTPPVPEQPQHLVTDKDVEAFGSDLIDVIDRKAREVARAEFAPKVAQLEAENAKLKGELTGVSERQTDSARSVYFANLARVVPDWEALNVDQQFLDWLAEVDPLSGLAKQEYLNRAYAAMDVERTATLFNTFKQSTAPAVQPVTRPSKQLQSQVAPSTSKASAPASVEPGTRIWHLNEIEQFYTSVRRGEYKGNDGERARIEAEIDLAVAAGRITS